VSTPASAAARGYDTFADLYDLWVDLIAPTANDGAFYQSLAATAKGQVIELGVGTGRIAVPMARSGRPVLGVDASGRMLARGRRRARAAGVEHLVTLVQADFRTWLPAAPADLVIMPFRTLDHLPLDRASLTTFFQHVAAMLSPGGRFAFNIANPRPAQLNRLDGVTIDLGTHPLAAGGSGTARLDMTNTHDWSRERYRCKITAQISRPDAPDETMTWSVDLGWVSVRTVAEALLAGGLDIVLLTGGFTAAVPSLPGVEQVWMAQRPG
jgi:SAM-dependent methyltransferase